jgi:very-short-patch-repair endonuclease/endogenous inhibitor of DNA gyrase (YacG/DUF329 family)
MPDIICACCGITFHIRPSEAGRARYCSRTCANTGLIVRQPRACSFCGKTYTPGHNRTSRFCSRKCQSEARRKTVSVTCGYCGKVFETYEQGAKYHRFCSKECGLASRKTQVEKICVVCGTTFTVKAAKAKQSKCCSRVCVNKMRDTRQEYNCEHCGKPFVVPKSTRSKGRKYCSYDCFLAGSEETSLELAIRRALRDLGIIFIPEYSIGPFFIDCYIPILNLAIECDGSYWHDRRQGKDRSRDAYLRACGIHTIRIRDTDLHGHNPIDIVRARIAELAPGQ